MLNASNPYLVIIICHKAQVTGPPHSNRVKSFIILIERISMHEVGNVFMRYNIEIVFAIASCPMSSLDLD